MITKLDHSNIQIAEQIYYVFQVSYSVEAKLLGALDFPPLKRTANSFLSCENDFYGFWLDNKVVAVVEIKKDPNFIHIQSMVVDPNYFRRGIAQQLIKYVFDLFNTPLFMVETGVDNLPARNLYEKFGFTETKQWDTDIGIRKIRYEK